MLDNKTYRRELVRMWDSLRDDNKGRNGCNGVDCKECPLHGFKYGCSCSLSAVEIYNAVEKWSKEHPIHYYVSQLEYDIILSKVAHSSSSLMDNSFGSFYDLSDLIEKGYFEGATLETNVGDYFNHCEVVDKWNKDDKRREIKNGN